MPLDDSINPPPQAVIDFWCDAGPRRWFAKNADFDADFKARFASAHDAAARGDLDGWLHADAAASPGARAQSALALLLLLDQYPRNAFRDTPRSFATDSAALDVATRALQDGLDQQVDPSLRNFFYLPFMHAEDLAAQERSLALTEPLGEEPHRYARVHRDAIAQFGRFPHRNAILGRISTPAENAYLAHGGFAG